MLFLSKNAVSNEETQVAVAESIGYYDMVIVNPVGEIPTGILDKEEYVSLSKKHKWVPVPLMLESLGIDLEWFETPNAGSPIRYSIKEIKYLIEYVKSTDFTPEELIALKGKSSAVLNAAGVDNRYWKYFQ